MNERRVLVVDDDIDVVRWLTRHLEKAGYAVAAALDGSQAMTQAQRFRPDLVVLDVLMPAGGGLTVLDRLCMSSKTNTIPVVILTASEEPEIGQRAQAAGVMRVLQKPCDPVVLLDTIDAAIAA